jgi:hypothetical protein
MIVEFYGTYSAFVNAALLGVLLGIVYDIFRIARISRMPYIAPEGRFYEIIKIPERKKTLPGFVSVSDKLLTFAEDIVFWIIASVAEVLFIYHINGGAVRVYFIMCTFSGAALYFFTVGKITMYFSVRIIFLLRCLLYWTFYIIIYPIRLILRFIVNVWRFIANNTIAPIKRIIKKRRLLSYSKKRISCILMQSKKGFIYD